MFPVTHYEGRIMAIHRLHARFGRISDESRAFLLRVTDPWLAELGHIPTDDELVTLAYNKLDTALAVERVRKRLTE